MNDELRKLIHDLADYVERVPDDRQNAEHLNPQALVELKASAQGHLLVSGAPALHAAVKQGALPMTDAHQIVILSAARTPIGTFGGAFAAVPPIELATIAARAALASRQQGKYAEMHDALMTMRGKVEPEAVLRIAAEVGLDVEKLKIDMQSPEVEEHIATSMRLAEALGFNGTPSFVVGDQLIPGFVEKPQLVEAVTAARAVE